MTTPCHRNCFAPAVLFCVLYLCVLFCCRPAAAAQTAPDAARPQDSRSLCDFTGAELDARLAALQQCTPRFADRLATLARLYRGCGPYVSDPLDHELQDWLPFRRTNCTMFVLYVTALANSASRNQARSHMRALHYRGGVVGFATRYHFTSDRITDPKNHYFSECTAACVRDPQILRSVTCTLNRAQNGAAFFNGRLGGWHHTVTLHYLPRADFRPESLRELPPVIGVAFLKKELWSRGVLVGHEGLLVNDDLYHASPGHGVNVVPGYLTREFADSPWEGLVFFSIHEVPLPPNN